LARSGLCQTNMYPPTLSLDEIEIDLLHRKE
jgi:hypothetical protein